MSWALFLILYDVRCYRFCNTSNIDILTPNGYPTAKTVHIKNNGIFHSFCSVGIHLMVGLYDRINLPKTMRSLDYTSSTAFFLCLSLCFIPPSVPPPIRAQTAIVSPSLVCLKSFILIGLERPYIAFSQFVIPGIFLFHTVSRPARFQLLQTLWKTSSLKAFVLALKSNFRPQMVHTV